MHPTVYTTHAFYPSAPYTCTLSVHIALAPDHTHHTPCTRPAAPQVVPREPHAVSREPHVVTVSSHVVTVSPNVVTIPTPRSSDLIFFDFGVSPCGDMEPQMW